MTERALNEAGQDSNEYRVYRLGHAYAKALGSHERAWLNCDENVSSALTEALETMRQALAGLGDVAAADRAADAAEEWRRAFRNELHLCWTTAYDLVTRHVGRGNVGKLLSDAVLRICTTLAPTKVGNVNLTKPLRRRLSAGLKEHGALRWEQALIFAMATVREELFPDAPQSHACQRMEKLVDWTLSRVGKLIGNPDVSSLTEKVPEAAFVTVDKLPPGQKGPPLMEWEVLRHSPSLVTLVELGGTVLEAARAWTDTRRTWLDLALHAGLLQYARLLPLDLVASDDRIVGLRIRSANQGDGGGWYHLDQPETDWLRSSIVAELSRLRLDSCVPQQPSGPVRAWAAEVDRCVSKCFAVWVEFLPSQDAGREDHHVGFAAFQQHNVPQGDPVALRVVQRPKCLPVQHQLLRGGGTARAGRLEVC